MGGSSFTVDVHTHPVPESYRRALLGAGYGSSNASDLFVDGFRTPEWTLDGYLEDCTAFGYNYSILSITAPGLSFLRGNARARTLARELNDEMSGWMGQHPKRLGAFGILPLPDINASLAEIAYCLDELGFDGIGLYTNVDGVYLGDSLFDPIMAELDRRNATVFVHPAGPTESPALDNMSLPVIEYPFDTTRAIANMLFKQTRLRYPNMKIIWSHAGGTVPFLASRLALQSTLPWHGGRDFEGSYSELQGYYYDTAVTLGNAQFAALKEFVGDDKIVTGSDFPYMPASAVPIAQAALESYHGFTEWDRERIAWKNAFELFPALKTKFPEVVANSTT
ncbi:uncharacterized protein A1O9_08001 [Exophiala aquamarina CBS 119918]|uniref:6-methylsalicylate decarboxylase n=1 Tax=Exophiala aquamarina CBS 119918 TaxID=1182545 RepID=A0A072PLM0_9EURO|nr:uncharacterized protein A1O9_08001 [Exophiala aquamarina CBS 119918]KEF56420.1 hypothetical protein A1O9_08001 [Exophiala aquamarina CBS 119918]